MASANIEDNNLPRVLIMSLNNEKAKEIASGIGGTYLIQDGDMDIYMLVINNKYYTAQIALCATHNLCKDPSNYEALIFYYDIESESSLRLIDEQLSPLLCQSEAETLLLVCSSISDSSVRSKAIEWCAHKKCELVEIQPKEIMDFEEDQSKYGIERIVEALETHVWPNITIRDLKKNNLQPLLELNEVGRQLENVQLSNTQELNERLQMESILDGIMNNDEADFGELFSNLRAMKEHAAAMPSNQRRLAAEHLVTAFWKAMGGDASEVDDTDNIEP